MLLSVIYQIERALGKAFSKTAQRIAPQDDSSFLVLRSRLSLSTVFNNFSYFDRHHIVCLHSREFSSKEILC